MGAADRNIAIAWQPQPGPQTLLLTCPVFEVFYGGARGGGKTDGVLGEFALHASRYGEHAIGLMVRRERTQLIETIERSRLLYGRIGGKYNEQDKLWRFPNGARLRFAYLEHDQDADAYQGHSYTRVYVEEIGTFPNQAPILKLMATLRSGVGVCCGFRATGNPGGPGHQWVKARYIDPAPKGWKILKEEFKNPWSGESVTRDRVYIPSRLGDNKFLGNEYVANLQMSGSPELVRAWLEGDWSVVSGAFFPEFRAEKHIIKPFEIPSHWARIRSMDWGSAKPFCVGWYAVSDGSLDAFPRGALIKYREWYGWNGTPNTGCKMVAEDVGQRIKLLERDEQMADQVLDPACFSQDGGPSIAERMNLDWRRADNSRVAKQGALGGWDQVRSRLLGFDGKPMIYFFSNCEHTIRTLPALQHDQHRAEDVDTEAEDHAGDETRYACMSRPIVRDAAPETNPVRGPESLTINQLLKRVQRKNEEYQ